MEQTAVEWLEEKLQGHLDISRRYWNELLAQAKEIEEKQRKCYHPLSERKYTSDTHFECTICGDNNY